MTFKKLLLMTNELECHIPNILDETQSEKSRVPAMVMSGVVDSGSLGDGLFCDTAMVAHAGERGTPQALFERLLFGGEQISEQIVHKETIDPWM